MVAAPHGEGDGAGCLARELGVSESVNVVCHAQRFDTRCEGTGGGGLPACRVRAPDTQHAREEGRDAPPWRRNERRVRQVALEEGSWVSGEVYLLTPDPTSPTQNPGDPGGVKGFRRAQRELKRNCIPQKVSTEDEATPTPNPKKPKPKMGNGRGAAARVADE